jgi:hypothetical protein
MRLILTLLPSTPWFKIEVASVQSAASTAPLHNMSVSQWSKD